jgi:hypothetical protein
MKGLFSMRRNYERNLDIAQGRQLKLVLTWLRLSVDGVGRRFHWGIVSQRLAKG